MYNFTYLINNKIMKKIVIFLLILILFAPFYGNFSFTLAEDKFYYTDNVEHLFTHCLLAYPETALAKNNEMRLHYNQDCITHNEFKNILKELYKNDYVLVDINKCFKIEDGKALKDKVKVPVGKKPIIFSFDDVNYDHKKLHLGMIDKLILDENGEIAELTNINGKDKITYDREFVCIMEDFIKKHPDFSVDGARGTLNLTGYDGILGYRTQKKNLENREEEINSAKKVIEKLKANGWTFASHSYGHYHMKKISTSAFKEELQSWKDEVESLVRSTKVYVYPYGEWEITDDSGEISEKHKLLEEYGFKLFCGVGMQQFYSYLPFNKNIKEKTLFMDRKVIDGFTLKNRTTALKPLFDTNAVYDYANRSLVN